MQTVKRVSVLAAGIIGALAFNAPQAVADGAVRTEFGGGVVGFVTHGEQHHFTVKDGNPDGYGAVGFLQIRGYDGWTDVTPPNGLYNGHGSGIKVGAVYLIPNDRTVRYQVCLVDKSGNAPFNCSGWHEDTT